MTYNVLLTKRAKEQLEGAARWWAERRSAATAQRWYDGFLRALLALENDPERCAIARENDAFPYEIRQLAYGLGRRVTHRAVFIVRSNDVVVFTIRHLAGEDITPDILD